MSFQSQEWRQLIIALSNMTKNLKLFLLSPLLTSTFSSVLKNRAARRHCTLQSANNKARNVATIIGPERSQCGMLRHRGKHIAVAKRHILDKNTTHVSDIIIARSTSRYSYSASVESIVHDPGTDSIPIRFSIRRGAGQ